jgi:hypothetical protein
METEARTLPYYAATHNLNLHQSKHLRPQIGIIRKSA